MATRIHDALAAPFPIAGHRMFVSASIGTAVNSAAHDAAEDLLRDAYSALVRAQSRGPGETQIFDDSARADAAEFMEFAADLGTALSERQFEMWFQPTVDLGDGSIVARRGAAALAPSRARPAAPQHLRAAAGRHRHHRAARLEHDRRRPARR